MMHTQGHPYDFSVVDPCVAGATPSDDDPEDDIREDEDIIANVVNEDPCRACGEFCGNEKYILNCGDSPFCSPCSEYLIEGNEPCPSCNEGVRIQILIRRQA